MNEFSFFLIFQCLCDLPRKFTDGFQRFIKFLFVFFKPLFNIVELHFFGPVIIGVLAIRFEGSEALFRRFKQLRIDLCFQDCC